jgi:ribosomal protein S18 acetylase RimI-like enzyme
MLEKAFIIRPARPEDIEPLVVLLRELFLIEKDFSPDAARQRTGLKQLMNKDRAVILIAESGGEVVGMCTVQTEISTAEGGPAGVLEDMIVTTRFRRQGIGQTLIESAEKWAEEHDLTRLQLLAESGNEAALKFYFNNCWHKTGLICLRKAVNK